MPKDSPTSQRSQLTASLLLLAVPLLLVGGLFLRDHMAKQRQREFAAQMAAMQIDQAQQRQQAVIQALEAAAPLLPAAEAPTDPAAHTPPPAPGIDDGGYSPPPPPPR